MPRPHGPDADLHEVLSAGLAELGAEVSAGQLATLGVLSGLVAAWGARINLTGHRDTETVARRLVLDAASLLAVLPPLESLADLGSGAGFPGLPMAILRPQLSVALVEARERRHHFQRHAIRTLGLRNARAVRGRFEEIEPGRCEAVIAQAVAPPERLVEWMLRWARPGAVLIVPGGTSPRSAGARVELSSSRSTTYRVPLGGPERTVWIGEVRV